MPVAESLSLGKFCIASNAGSLPEIAPGIVDLIDPQDFMSWCERIERYVLRPSLRRAREEQAKTYRCHSWTETAAFIAGQLKRVYPTEELAELSLGSKISFAAVEEAAIGDAVTDRICIGGWGHPERQGRWTIGTSAALCFRLGIDRPIALTALATAFVPEGSGPQFVHVTLNGVVVAAWQVDGRVRWFMAALQPELLNGTGKAVVRFNIRDPRVPANYNPGMGDSRPLGLFIQSLMIEPILTLTSGQLTPIAPDTACDVLISFRTQVDLVEYLVLRLNAEAAGFVKVSLNNTHFDFAEIPVSLGEQVRVVKMDALEKGASEFTILAIRSEPSANIRILEVGVFAALTPEVMRSLRGAQDDRTTTRQLAHLTWYGQPTMIPPHTNIQTVQGSPATAGMVGGWHIPEPIGTWSSGSPSSLFLTLPPLDTDNLLIEMTFMPYEWHFAAGEGFELDVLIGTCPVRTIRRMHPGAVTESFRVPARLALDAHRVLRITTRGMTGLAPNLFGESDSRALSFMLTDIAVRPMRSFALEPGMSIPLGQASLTLLLENWHEPDPEWAWSPGGIETRLQLQLSPPAEEEDEIRIGLDLEVYSELLTRGPATLRFLVDETEIATVVRAETGFRPIILRLPRAAIDETSFSCVLSIHAPVGISLYGAGESSDIRPLSFRIRTLHYMTPETEEKSPDTDARASANDWQPSEDDSELSSRRHSHGLMRRPAILGGALDLLRKPSNGKFNGRHEKL